jgi:hypothetical protein
MLNQTVDEKGRRGEDEIMESFIVESFMRFCDRGEIKNGNIVRVWECKICIHHSDWETPWKHHLFRHFGTEK